MYEDLFVSYEVAVKLKEIGFKEPCIARYVDKQLHMNVLAEWYDHNSGVIKEKWISAPLYDQVIRWFLDKNICLTVRYLEGYVYRIYIMNPDKIQGYSDFGRWSYVESLERGVIQSIKHLENGRNTEKVGELM